jgi:hypothetical protein
VQAFLGLDLGFGVEGQVDFVSEGLKEAFLVHHVGLQNSGHEGLAMLHGVIQSDSEPCGVVAARIGSGGGEEVDQARGRHAMR